VIYSEVCSEWPHMTKGGVKTGRVYLIYNYSSKLDIYIFRVKPFLRTLAPPRTDRLLIYLPCVINKSVSHGIAIPTHSKSGKETQQCLIYIP
jgi:hypothetical protein